MIQAISVQGRPNINNILLRRQNKIQENKAVTFGKAQFPKGRIMSQTVETTVLEQMLNWVLDAGTKMEQNPKKTLSKFQGQSIEILDDKSFRYKPLEHSKGIVYSADGTHFINDNHIRSIVNSLRWVDLHK